MPEVCPAAAFMIEIFMRRTFMKLRTIILGAMVTSGIAAYAQEATTPLIETGLDYTFTRVNPGGNLTSYNSNGGSGFVEYNLNHVVGLVADLGANYIGNVNGFAVDNTAFTYLFGPRFNWRRSRLTFYMQTLVGGERFSNAYDPGSPSPVLGTSENTFAAAIGGGVDYRLTDHLAIKPIQVEYFMTQLPSSFANVNEVQNNLRYSAGIVFRVGSK
jgi:opacity protein-like surface antigen